MKAFWRVCKSHYFPYAVLFALAITYCFPILKNISYWGQMDWDQFTFWHAVPRKTLLEFRQFPLWNPYSNGGNVLLALPHSSFLSPFFIFVLFFGPVIGLKIMWVLSVYIGLLGAYYVAKHFQMDSFAAFFASLVFMLNSLFALHLTEGHVEWLAMALVPWVFLFYSKHLCHRKYIVFTSICLTLMVLGGNIYILATTVIFTAVYGVLHTLRERNFQHTKALLRIFVLALLLSSVKITPMLEFLADNPRKIESREGMSPALLPAVFLSRQQDALYQNSKWTAAGHTYKQGNREIDYGWHEYGAYVGALPLLLAFLGAAVFFRTYWPLVFSGLACVWVALGSGAPFNLWEFVHAFPIYDSLHVPSRFLAGLMLPLCICGALGLSKIRQLSGGRAWYRVCAGFLCAFVFVDLLSVNYPLLNSAFSIRPVSVQKPVEFKQRYRDLNLFPGKSRSSMYPAFLSNSGILNAYEVVHVRKGKVRVMDEPGYKGEAYLLNATGSARICYFSPQKIIVDIDAGGTDTLVLNQNHFSGWRAQGAERKDVFAHEGLVAVSVQPSDKRILFRYLPNSFIIGASMTLITLFFGVGMWIIAGIIKRSPRRYE